MSTEDKMTIDERRKYLSRMKKRYVQANHKERGRLLDEMEVVTELHRKSLIRLMRGSLERKPRRRQRGCTYGPRVDDALRIIAESLDYVCAARLTPNLVWMAEHLADHQELEQPPLSQKRQPLRRTKELNPGARLPGSGAPGYRGLNPGPQPALRQDVALLLT